MANRPKKPTKLSPLPARSEQFLAGTASVFQEKLIGRTIISWSKLEAAIDHAI
jgi:hypothetical protein